MAEIIRGQYEIIGEVGKGGMGLVLKARDLKLNRLVAMKVLRADQRADDERRRRFFNEAQAASALNHPNIITIYDIVNEGEHDYLVMEFVQGKTLGDLLQEGQLSYRLVIQYGVQIAEALATAHAAGIVHRDMKPGNVMVTERGLVKVLDFGLAKLGAPLDDPNGANDPEATHLAPMTREGFILGTCAYMSPEQAQGKPVDARSDIFSFGAVLYEMATGKRAFQGDNNITTLSAVLRDEPRSIMELMPNVPVPLERLIHRCLRKEPGERWQTMEEVRAALAALKQSADSGILDRGADPSTLAMPAALPGGAGSATMPKPEPSPFAAPPPGTQAGAQAGSSRRAPWLLRSKWGLVGIAVAAGVFFGPLGKKAIVVEGTPEREERRRDSSAKAKAEAVKEKVAEALREAAEDLQREELDNDAIVEMAKAKVPDTVIIGQIRDAKTSFDMSTDEVIKLVKAGVPESVIEAMRNPKAIPPGPPRAPGLGGAMLTIPDGTPLRLELAADILGDVQPGAPLAFVVASEVSVVGSVAIPKGAPARGIVLKRIRGRGKSVRIQYELTEVDGLGGARISLRSAPARGVNIRDLVVTTEDSMAASKGTEFVAYVEGEHQLFLPRPKR